MSVALKNNPRSAIVHLDLSDNNFDDKCMFTVYVLLYHSTVHTMYIADAEAISCHKYIVQYKNYTCTTVL